MDNSQPTLSSPLLLRYLQNVGGSADPCFYCGGQLHQDSSEVDHFIAWSRFPKDAAHNFVLAHRSSNNAKRDMLAAQRHMKHRPDRNASMDSGFTAMMQQTRFMTDLDTPISVAQ